MRIPTLVTFAFLAACATEFPDAVDAGADPGGPDALPSTGPTVLPFAVDDWYGPSGYMGDGENPGAIEDAMTCLDDRPSTWMGRCHRYTWTPTTQEWAGVYWQYPDGNWGDRPGLAIPAGASRVSFRAWGQAGTEVVDFMVGMMAIDGFQVTQMEVALGTEPAQYSLELGGASYGRVVGGFGWVTKDSTAPVTFGIDDIRWE